MRVGPNDASDNVVVYPENAKTHSNPRGCILLAYRNFTSYVITNFYPQVLLVNPKHELQVCLKLAPSREVY